MSRRKPHSAAETQRRQHRHLWEDLPQVSHIQLEWCPTCGAVRESIEEI